MNVEIGLKVGHSNRQRLEVELDTASIFRSNRRGSQAKKEVAS